LQHYNPDKVVNNKEVAVDSSKTKIKSDPQPSFHSLQKQAVTIETMKLAQQKQGPRAQPI